MKIRSFRRTLFLSCILPCLGLSAACTGQSISLDATATPFPPSATLPPSRTATPTASFTSTITPYPTLTASPTPLPTATPPAKAAIKNIQGTYQTYALGCEANAAAQMARFFGLSINEREFQAVLPLSDNPDVGFVGPVEGDWGNIPPAAYGVHAEPVAAELRNFGLNAIPHRQYTVEKIRQEIAAGRPVMVWVIGGVRQGRTMTYTAEDGSVITVAPYEHTVLVTGYGPDYFTILDGKEVYHRSIAQFTDSWGVLDNMAVTMGVPHFLPEPKT
ncbi:MAG: C39 family peptidase [Anaerolineaceae bacterium]|jgi:uncharacterized protein YvpB|nr:C39 family peptidase [Anaerolineaceae bacterium]